MARNKGQRAEREAIAILSPIVEKIYTEQNVSPPLLQRNTLQSDRGGADIAGLEWLALEIKHCETFNLNSWWAQTLEQATHGRVPVLFYRRNGVKFRVRMLGGIGGGNVWSTCLCDVSMDEFLIWFEAKLSHELSRRLSQRGY